eukprot:scaffold60194_cov20-Prasinocladus_malaysianus.AAC.1
MQEIAVNTGTFPYRLSVVTIPHQTQTRTRTRINDKNALHYRISKIVLVPALPTTELRYGTGT